MKKIYGACLLLTMLVLPLTGCSGIGDKAASASTVYCVTAVLSVLVMAAYLCLIRKKNAWFLLLFSSVLVVNAGYLALSLSQTLEAALWCNRLAYLGSVFLPASMLMIILDTCRIKYRKGIPRALLAIGTAVFLVAASPGYLDIYYKEVSLSVVNGMTILEKVYGPWHCLYLFYLLAYFLGTAAVLFHACINRDVQSAIHAVFMSAAVFINMGVWLLEQIVRIDFELLSVSYIVSEMFLLLLCLMLQNGSEIRSEQEEPASVSDTPLVENSEVPQPEQAASRTLEERCEYFAAQRASLTPTERAIYQFYLAGKTTKEIMAELNIKENTLKYHNKNIYSKLGVSSRKELVAIASMLKSDD